MKCRRRHFALYLASCGKCINAQRGDVPKKGRPLPKKKQGRCKKRREGQYVQLSIWASSLARFLKTLGGFWNSTCGFWNYHLADFPKAISLNLFRVDPRARIYFVPTKPFRVRSFHPFFPPIKNLTRGGEHGTRLVCAAEEKCNQFGQIPTYSRQVGEVQFSKWKLGGGGGGGERGGGGGGGGGEMVKRF